MYGDIRALKTRRIGKTKTDRFFTLIKCLLSSLLCIACSIAYAQFEQKSILEIPIRNDNDYFEIIPSESEGLILYKVLSAQGKNQIQIIHTDTAFQQKWSGYIPVDKKLILSGQHGTKKKLSLLFQNNNFSESNFYLFQIDLKSGEYSQYIIRNFIPFIPTQFESTERGVLIGGYFIKVPLVLFFDTQTISSKILPGLFNEPGELTQININSDNSFDVLISSKNWNKQKTLWVKNYDQEGGLLRNTMLDPGEDVSLLFGRSVKDFGKNEIIAGVYGGRNTDYSRGMFVASINTDGEQSIRYYNFADLENFFKYMRAKREKRIKERIARKKIKGKKIKFSYRFLVHELVPLENQIIFLGEAFYPRYRSSQSGGFGTSSYSNLIFDGYQYTHAVVLGINNDGKLIWDNSFEINDVKTFTLEQFVKMDVRSNQIALLYLYKNEIRSKVIEGNEVVEGKTFNELTKKFDDTTPIASNIDVSKLDYWYNNTFYAYGIKTIPSSGPRGRQRVFYVSKISYQ